MSWIKALLSAADPTVSLRHTAYAVVVAAGVGWLTFWLIQGPRDANWVAAFGLLLAAVTTAKAMKSSGQTPPGAQQ